MDNDTEETLLPSIRKNYLSKVQVLFTGLTDEEEAERQTLIYSHIHNEGKPIFGSSMLDHPKLRDGAPSSTIDFMIVGCSKPDLKKPFMVLVEHWSDIEEESSLDFDAVQISFVKALHQGNRPAELLRPSYAIATNTSIIRTTTVW